MLVDMLISERFTGNKQGWRWEDPDIQEAHLKIVITKVLSRTKGSSQKFVIIFEMSGQF